MCWAISHKVFRENVLLMISYTFFQKNLELLYEEKLLEKIALNIKIIEVVCEAFGQLVVQSIVLLRLKTLIQTDYFKYLGTVLYKNYFFQKLKLP
jgi:hypothetical protein